MNDVDALLIQLMALDGTITNYHLQTLYVDNYQLHLAADRARKPLNDFEDRIQERIRIRFGREPLNSVIIFREAVKLVKEKPTATDIINACMDIQETMDDIDYGKGAENIFGDIAEHLDFIIALFSKQKG